MSALGPHSACQRRVNRSSGDGVASAQIGCEDLLVEAVAALAPRRFESSLHRPAILCTMLRVGHAPNWKITKINRDRRALPQCTPEGSKRYVW